MTMFEAPTVSQALPLIMKDLLEYGDEVGSRNGRVKEILNARITLVTPADREVLTINRKANVFAQIAETMWVIAGRNDIEWLSAYLPRAVDYSDDGETWRAGYGPRIRSWATDLGQHGDGNIQDLDQLAYVVDTLRADPLSRQAVIGIWDPAVDTTPGKDKACNTFLQFQSRGGALYLTVNVRSNDVMWGWSGINAFEWSTLQEMVASILGIRVGELVFNIGSLHLYEPHWDKASRLEYESMPYPSVRFDPERTVKSVKDLDDLLNWWFLFEEACRQGRATVAHLNECNEPLVKSWAAAIAYYWQREDHWLEEFRNTALAVAVARTPASMLPEPRVASTSTTAAPGHTAHLHERTGAFYAFVTNLHTAKDKSYGDSWKKRGEKLSILANMARKVDRLGVGDEFDSSADTVLDLFVYAVKYHGWLLDANESAAEVNMAIGLALGEVEEFDTAGEALDITFADVVSNFDNYVDNLDDNSLDQKIDFVTDLVIRLAPVARDLWWNEQQNAEIDKIHGPGAAAAIEAAYKDGSLFSDEYRGADVD